ncbi:MAG: FAD-binding protein, partial [Candidatus Acidiferrales bacterium]
EEGWRYTQGDRNARRPPELLTRDHVSRCIVREIREGRGTPHGGVFLDISWIQKRLPNAAEHIKRKLPSMYHQFKQLADIDITSEAMEVGPTTHYIMGGVRVDADSQMSTVAGLFAAGECAAGLHGANRLGGNSLSDLLVFGKRAGAYAAQFAKEQGAGKIDEQQVEAAARWALTPFASDPDADGALGARRDNPYQIQHDLQEMMQDLVGIVRREEEMVRAREELQKLRTRLDRISVSGNREYNPGWHTALDLHHLLAVSEAITLSAIERKESGGAHFREDYPGRDQTFSNVNVIVRMGADGAMQVVREPIPEMRQDLQAVIQEMK